MARNNKLLEEAKRIVSDCSEKEISYVGSKPWFQRALTKTKFGIVAGVIAGVSSFSMFHAGTTESTTEHFIKPSGVSSGTITPVESRFIKIDADDAVAKLHLEHPDIDFGGIDTQRDVAKAYLGKNNFISLAAEMEGFRGDLHKDPAVGLNIGFGYNISKRVASGQGEVVKDLLSIGLDNDTISKIIDVAKKPQKDLIKEIKKLNHDLSKDNNQLISIEQGVALLKRTQLQYQAQAKNVFSSTFEKMGQHQQDVLTYAAYKAGPEALGQYKKAIHAAEHVYGKKKVNTPTNNELKSIAKELTFYYKKDGKEMVLDERATLIAQTFVHQDYLGVQIGSNKVQQTTKKLHEQKIDFSHLKLSLNNDSEHQTKKINVKFNKNVLDNFRQSAQTKNSHKLG